MNKEWDLSIFYKGIDTPEFKEDMKKLEGITDFLKGELDKALKENDPVKKAEILLKAGEEETLLIYRVLEYCFLYLATHSDDGDVMAARDKAYRFIAPTAGIDTAIAKELAKLPDIDKLAEKSELVKEYKFYLEENKEKCKHMLSDAEEEMFATMNAYAGGGWGNFRDFVTSNVKVDYRGEEISLSEVRNKAYDKDAAVRKDAYEAEMKCYESFKDSVAFALNNIKNQVIVIGKKRGYDSPLGEALVKSRMKKETLDAMMGSMRKYIPELREFYKAKAYCLGHKNGLPWYDLFAPTGAFDREFTTEDCRDYLMECFSTFNPEVAAFLKEAFDNSWIDFFPRKGKLGGAFDSEALGFGQSRVMTNFDGTFGSVDTLAHELGHAFHDRQIVNQRPLNHEYSMPIAETASTFNETFLGHYAYNTASDEEKISLLDSSLSESLQCVIDITSRFIFESEVFEKCSEKFLMPDDLNEIMTKAQQETYGDSIDPEFSHKFMWANKSHYYSEGLSFYNFPYAFGLLFSMGLYAMYLEDKDGFFVKYKEMLHNTPTCTIEDCGKFMGVDLTKPDFWEASLKILLNDVNEYARLVGYTE